MTLQALEIPVIDTCDARCCACASAASRKRIESIQWLLISSAIIAIATISRAGMIAWPFLNDSGLYVQMGRTVANGGVLYRDFYETKFPGVGLLASAFWRTFGPNWAGYVLSQLAMTFIAAAALARSVHGRSRSGWPTFLFAVAFLNLSQAVYTGFQLETLQAFFEALAAMAAIQSIRRDDAFATFATGLSAGMAAMAKPGGLGVAVALAIVLMLKHRRRVVHLGALLGGAAIPLGVTIFYAVVSGGWFYLPAVARDIQLYATGTPVQAEAILKLLVALFVLAFPLVMRRTFSLRISPISLFVALWFAADLAAVLLQRRLYPYHFLPLACPAALIYGLMPGRMKPMPIALGLLPISLLSLTWEGTSITNVNRGAMHMPVSDYIVAHTTASDSVFADQVGRLLIETDRQPGSRLGTFFYLVNDDDAPARYMRVLLTDFETRRPKYLVLPNDWDRPIPGLANCEILSQCPQRRESFIAQWQKFRDYVSSHYRIEAEIDGSLIYHRTGNR